MGFLIDINEDEIRTALFEYNSLLKIFKKLNTKLLIKDCSYLCFPTLHLFAPEISNAYYYDNNMDYLPVLKAIGRLGQSFRMQENKFQPKRAKILLNDLLVTIVNIVTVVHMITGINLIFA